MDPVQDQYEHFPYPQRDPEDEAKRLVTGSPSGRDEINHFLFGGARDWSQPFRALVAGGGTGDAVIMLAQELADVGCPAEIIYIDLSSASRAIAEARAAKRGLSSITFVTDSLLDAGAHGPFDYIDCCGVLHHLPDPAEGFAALAKALKPGGGMGLMLYGELGRAGVYDAQEMLRTLTKKGESGSARVEIAKRLLSSLPDTNRLRRNPFIKDYQAGDAGVFDLLLHTQDRAYKVPEIYDALGAAGLDMAGFVAPANYDPDFLVTDAKLKGRLARLSQVERETFAELLTGNIKRHMFYCAPKDDGGADRLARFAPDMIPVLHHATVDQLLPLVEKQGTFSARREGLKITLSVPPFAADLLKLCDGKRSFADIQKALPNAPARDEFVRQAEQVYRAFHSINLMLLRKA